MLGVALGPKLIAMLVGAGAGQVFSGWALHTLPTLMGLIAMAAGFAEEPL